MLAGCNLLSGAADLVTPVDPGTVADVDAGFDSSFAPDGGSSGGGPDGSRDGRTANDDGMAPIPDAAIDAFDASPPRPDGGRFVFVTSTQLTGDLGGVAGADTSCTTIATNAGLGGVWMAWVTTAASAASSRLTSAGPWYLVTGPRVAASKAALAINVTIEHAIDRDEQGAQRINSPVWTGTGIGNFGDCSTWTSALPGGMAETGNTQYAAFQWQELGSAACNTTHRLYCFEN